MIPPVEERQVRPCEICVHYGGKKIFKGTGITNLAEINGGAMIQKDPDRLMPVCNIGRFKMRRGYCGRFLRGRGPLKDCTENYTPEEYQEQQNSMAKNIATYKFEGPVDVSPFSKSDGELLIDTLEILRKDREEGK